MPTSEKLDLFKLHRAEYAAPKKPVLLDVGKAHYLVADGKGAPGGEEFQLRVGALYAAAYTLKFVSKQAGRDYAVSKLEAVWWADGKKELDQVPQGRWRWQLMIRRPEFIGKKELGAAVKVIRDKGKTPGIEAVGLESLTEGRCVQMLHVGPYDREHETIAAMQALAEENGLAFHGRHHEIYLSDPRRVAPQKLKTILRRPVR